MSLSQTVVLFLRSFGERTICFYFILFCFDRFFFFFQFNERSFIKIKNLPSNFILKVQTNERIFFFERDFPQISKPKLSFKCYLIFQFKNRDTTITRSKKLKF